MDNTYIQLLIGVVPLVSVLLSYITTRLTIRYTDTKAVKLKRYNTLYVPFMQEVCWGELWRFSITDISETDQSKIIKIITDNISLMDKHSLKFVPAFYKNAVDYSANKNKRKHKDNSIPQKYEDFFIEFTKCMLKEASRLSKSLRLPNIGKTVLRFYYQNPPGLSDAPEKPPEEKAR